MSFDPLSRPGAGKRGMAKPRRSAEHLQVQGQGSQEATDGAESRDAAVRCRNSNLVDLSLTDVCSNHGILYYQPILNCSIGEQIKYLTKILNAAAHHGVAKPRPELSHWDTIESVGSLQEIADTPTSVSILTAMRLARSHYSEVRKGSRPISQVDHKAKVEAR